MKRPVGPSLTAPGVALRHAQRKRVGVRHELAESQRAPADAGGASLDRRALLSHVALTALGSGALAGCAPARVEGFGTWAEARNAVAALARPGSRWHATGDWNLSASLQHLAQSIEGAIAGYPQARPAWFVATLGAAAHAVFEARGRMTHSLSEPIPGAPPLDASLPTDAAVLRLLKAMDAFESHTGRLAPHFAYGALSKAQYARAHLMHLSAHWTQFAQTRDA